jgi:hypothetical protein
METCMLEFQHIVSSLTPLKELSNSSPLHYLSLQPFSSLATLELYKYLDLPLVSSSDQFGKSMTCILAFDALASNHVPRDPTSI